MKEFVQNSLRTLHQGFDKSVIVLTSRKFMVLAMATCSAVDRDRSASRTRCKRAFGRLGHQRREDR